MPFFQRIPPTEGFSRLCAINGGTFMLDHSVDEILYDASGVAYGIRHGDEVNIILYVYVYGVDLKPGWPG